LWSTITRMKLRMPASNSTNVKLQVKTSTSSGARNRTATIKPNLIALPPRRRKSAATTVTSLVTTLASAANAGDVQEADRMRDVIQGAVPTIEEIIRTVARDVDPDHPEVAVTADQDLDHVHHHAVTVKEVTETSADQTTVETTGATLNAGMTETTATAEIAMILEADVATAHHKSAVQLATTADQHQTPPSASAETAEKSNLRSTCPMMPPNAVKTLSKETAPPPTTTRTKEETEYLPKGTFLSLKAKDDI